MATSSAVHAGFTVDSHRRVLFLRLNDEITRLGTQIASYISNKRVNTEANTYETAKVKQMAEDPSTILLNKLVKLKMNCFLIVDIVVHSSDSHRVFYY